MEGAIREPKKIDSFFGSDKLLMTEIKSERPYNDPCCLIHNDASGSIFFAYKLVFFVGEDIGDLITLKSNL